MLEHYATRLLTTSHMIYTCYYLPQHRSQINASKLYQGFGLEPEVNPDITLNCPELDQRRIRRQLVEYGCCLWLWRNIGQIPHHWIGLTSYRQNEKTTRFFDTSSNIESALEEHCIATWGMTQMYDQEKHPISLALQAEACHPGITEFISDVFTRFSLDVPEQWFNTETGIYANYWAMKKPDFIEYMDFSWPLVEYALGLIDQHPYMLNQIRYKTVNEEKALGYFTERLFIIWYLREEKSIANLGRTMQVRNKVPVNLSRSTI